MIATLESLGPVRWAVLLGGAAAAGALLLAACSQEAPTTAPTRTPLPAIAVATTRPPASEDAGHASADHLREPAHAATTPAPASADAVRYTLQTAIADHRLAFQGIGGAIEGRVNPSLQAPGDTVVEITLVNGDGAIHDIVIPDLNAHSPHVEAQGDRAVLVFKTAKEGRYAYFCSVPGHRQAGMEGVFIVSNQQEEAQPEVPSVVRDPADLPGPIGVRAAQAVRLNLEAVELRGRLADGASYAFWTYNGQVPGPFLRVRAGDSVTVDLKNRKDSTMTHSIDLHAVTGPGGGSTLTQAAPGETRSFTFKALNPGLYVYHCATPMVAQHIANGMYGLILVEPPAGLPAVDREFYVMQGEVYTKEALGTQGPQEFAVEKLLRETPEYFVFNGAAGALTKEHPLKARVGEVVRIYMGVGGPNFTSSFHVIGEIFDRVYDQASLTAAPLTDVQTTLVPPGGATIVEFRVDVPGRYILVDHALARLERGLAGYLEVGGADQPGIYRKEGA